MSTGSADLITTQVLWNSVLSIEGAKYMCLDVGKFYLETPTERYKYMNMPINFSKSCFPYILCYWISDQFLRYVMVLPVTGCMTGARICSMSTSYLFCSDGLAIGLWAKNDSGIHDSPVYYHTWLVNILPASWDIICGKFIGMRPELGL